MVSVSSRYQERLAQVEKVLLIDKTTINMNELRSACTYGIPDALRSLAWRLLLNYLPPQREQWKDFLKLQRENYDTMIEQLLTAGPSEPNEDHPLSDSSESEWSTFFDDNRILGQIDKDCRRLRPEMQFFQLSTQYPHKISSKVSLSSRVGISNLQTEDFDIAKKPKKPSNEIVTPDPLDGPETHWQVCERILFVYAKLNPGVKYVQGMNEVLGPLYYVFAADPDEEWAPYAEADTFYCFQQFMSEIKDYFIKTLDNSDCGIESSMSSFHSLVGETDPELFIHLVQKLSISPQFYAFRWLSLLLSQEFPLPDVITIWDSLFADPKRFSLLPYICLAMLQLQREFLLKSDFSDCLHLLQNYPAVDVNQLVSAALVIREGNRTQRLTVKEHKRTLSDKLRELGGYWKR